MVERSQRHALRSAARFVWREDGVEAFCAGYGEAISVLEGTFTSKLISKLRKQPALRRAVIIKHANPFHRGVPDFSVTIGRRTWWYEVKRWGEVPTKIQSWHLERMAGEVIAIAPAGNGAIITPIGALGFLLIDELVEEIATRCLV